MSVCRGQPITEARMHRHKSDDHPARALRTEAPAHTGRKPVADRSAPRPEALRPEDKRREVAGAVRDAKPFARSGRGAAPATGGPMQGGTEEPRPLPRPGTTRQSRSGEGSSSPRECGPQSGEGGGRREARSFGGLRESNNLSQPLVTNAVDATVSGSIHHALPIRRRYRGPATHCLGALIADTNIGRKSGQGRPQIDQVRVGHTQ